MNENIIEKELLLSDLAKMLSIDTSMTRINDIDDLGLEIETPNGFKKVTSYVVKEKTQGWQLDNLIASSVHRVLHDEKWKYVKDILGPKALMRDIEVVDL